LKVHKLLKITNFNTDKPINREIVFSPPLSAIERVRLQLKI